MLNPGVGGSFSARSPVTAVGLIALLTIVTAMVARERDKPPASAPERLRLVKTVYMHTVLGWGTSVLGTGGDALWGVETADRARASLVKVSREDGSILQSFPAPAEYFVTSDGCTGVAFIDETLWVMNFMEDVFYVLDSDTGKIVNLISAPCDGRCTGLAFDGATLWYGQNARDGLTEGALIHQIDKAGTIIRSIRVPFPYVFGVAVVRGKLLISGLETPRGPHLFYVVDPSTGAIVRRFERQSCEFGIAFDGTSIWTADPCGRRYHVYEVPSDL